MHLTFLLSLYHISLCHKQWCVPDSSHLLNFLVRARFEIFNGPALLFSQQLMSQSSVYFRPLCLDEGLIDCVGDPGRVEMHTLVKFLISCRNLCIIEPLTQCSIDVVHRALFVSSLQEYGRNAQLSSLRFRHFTSQDERNVFVFVAFEGICHIAFIPLMQKAC